MATFVTITPTPAFFEDPVADYSLTCCPNTVHSSLLGTFSPGLGLHGSMALPFQVRAYPGYWADILGVGLVIGLSGQ